MIKIALFAGGIIDNFSFDFDFFVGVDRGSLFLIEQGINPDLAVGDFDSVTPAEMDKIKSKSRQLITAQIEKNDTDLELAVKSCFERYPQAQLTIFGAFGGRMEHTLASIFMPSIAEIAPYMQQICLVDQQNQITYIPKGRHQILPVTGMEFLGFLPVQDIEFRIEGAKYPLNEENFFFKKVYTSNEFIDQPVFVEVEAGYVVVIYSKDRR